MLPNHLIPPIGMPGTAYVDDTFLPHYASGVPVTNASASSDNLKRHCLRLPRPMGWAGISPVRAISRTRRLVIQRNFAAISAATNGSMCYPVLRSWGPTSSTCDDTQFARLQRCVRKILVLVHDFASCVSVFIFGSVLPELEAADQLNSLPD